MEFRATNQEFLAADEIQMLSPGKHHYPAFSSTPPKERAFFRCSDSPVMEQTNDDHAEAGELAAAVPIEKEHMFDKVVTPSDVGKLNRLVIPKQHAERYFPLDSSGNEKGLLLNFEDRNGKSWRFRYSYWNSSQSYVITKGWSRFVKEKRLDAGDIVSFQRGVGESNKHRLFIDWRRRRSDHVVIPNSRQQHPFVPMMNMNMNMNNQGLVSVPNHQQYLFRGSVSSWAHPSMPRVSTGSVINSYRGAHYGYGNSMFYGGGGDSMMNKPMIFESVPVVQGKKKAESKRLRLFGVNMECPNTESDECIALNQPPNYLHNRGNSILGTDVSDKGKSSSLSFDFGC